ncbi:hypothetical protein AMS58_09220 [Pseudoalteromonas porphyrae]|uniref:CPBP family intramembrane glutamic endopeptidase n=1 Tax=Pseudoalteromonas TaxID=53246 RepID=UPI0006BAB3B6|nr:MULTISPECIES: CPBP family intramembrane glutamic endopeptidase [Pseudoalteromonas]KPH95089.1 hypothetical protein AMS58_09220 [Pseudoalteromonas porphyrae]
MKYQIKALLLVITFIFCHYGMKYFWGKSWIPILSELDQHTDLLLFPAKYLFIYGPFLLIATVLFKSIRWYELLGLNIKDSQRYLLAALACCTPMVIGYAFLSSELNISISGVVTGSIYAGFFEEVIFRAALFGILFRFCRWGFIPAALISSIIFGLGHIYQGHDVISALMAVTITTIAGTWFAWLYCECGYRIWFPLWMHILMNAAYGIFSMSGGAAGDLKGNLFKATAIILSIVYINVLIKGGKKREVTLSSLFKNQPNSSSLSIKTPTYGLNDA